MMRWAGKDATQVVISQTIHFKAPSFTHMSFQAFEDNGHSEDAVKTAEFYLMGKVKRVIWQLLNCNKLYLYLGSGGGRGR